MTAIAIACTLGLLSVLHVYWAFGGTWGIAAAIPVTGGRSAFTPSRATTFLVALGLATASLVVLLQGRILRLGLPSRPVTWVTIGLGLIFLARAIGDFRLVGFFKQHHGTLFAVRDTWLYSPLCLLLALGFFVVSLQ